MQPVSANHKAHINGDLALDRYHGARRPRLHGLDPLTTFDSHARFKCSFEQEFLKICAMVQQERVARLQFAEIQIQNSVTRHSVT